MNKKKIALIVAAAGLLISLFAQKNKESLFRGWYKKADSLYNLDEPTEKTDSTALKLFLDAATAASGINYAVSIESLIKAGNIHQGYRRFSDANNLYHAAIYINDRHLKKITAAYEAYLYLGSSLYFSNIIDSAQHYFEAASDIAMNYTGKESLPEQATLYNSLGAIYYESANYRQAKNYFEKALGVSPKAADDYNDLYTGIQSNIANCLIKLKQYNAALLIFKSLSPDEQQKEIIQQNTAHSYFELGLYDSALSIYQSLPMQSGFAGVAALTNMGRIYMQRKQWQQAEVVFDSAIARNKNISLTIKNKEEALAYMYRSRLAELQGLQDEAITWINEALEEVHLNFSYKNIDDLPADISQTVSPITLFNILHVKASLLYKKYNRTKQKQLLSASLASYCKAMETANFIKLNFDNDEAKLFFNENYRPIYSEAIGVAHDAASINDAHANDYLFIIENYKGNVLYQNLQNVLLKSTVSVPDSIRRREKELKQLLAFYTSRLNYIDAEKDAEQLQNRLLSLQVELSRLQKKYEKDAGYNLYKYRLADNKPSMVRIQSGLAANTALINYYAGDSAIYCLAVTKKDFLFKKIDADSLFYGSASSFINEVYHHTEGRRYEGFASSAQLYHYLIEPIEKTAGSCENWVIIPDGILYYLPFEAMVKDEQKRNYLMLTKTISYHYSFALLLEKNTHHFSDDDSKGSVAFAPYSYPDEKIKASQLPVLPFSVEELSGITENIYTGTAATKKKFLQTTSQHPFIHLATHASIGADSSSNWIQFYPADSADMNNKLFVHDIYNLDLHRAELVILSACETGGGVTATGEGLLSLSRAFMYAGADGIISTLWKTEDRVTAFLMQRIHGYLKQKISPEKALQMAKKDLLNDKVLGSQYKTPNYWANFIYAGKLHGKPESKKRWIWFTGIFITVIAATFFIYRQTKKASPKY